jgi:hypothetical protein
MDVYVKFEVWNVVSKAFEAVGNMPVDLMDEDPHWGDDLIDTQTTDANGFIHFSVTEADLEQKSGEDKPDLYFNAHPRGLRFGDISLPDDWSTSGWKDKNGKPGLFPNTAFDDKNPLGGASPADPLVYRIGVDYHVSFQFWDPSESKQQLAPKGLRVGLIPSAEYKHFQRTDKLGQLHGLAFHIRAGTDVSFYVEFNIVDPDINLPEATVEFSNDGENTNFWYTNEADGDQRSLPHNTETSIGTQTIPIPVSCALGRRNVATSLLTMLYEHTSFFFHITGGAWTGVRGLDLSMHAVSGTAYSWPVGTVHIPEEDWWNRGTIMHELSHQVMWKEAGISSLDIAGWIGAPISLQLHHRERMLANPLHAVVEGWAEIFEGIFDTGSITISSVAKLEDSDGDTLKHSGADVQLGPLPVNQGQSVEGAFAHGLISVFESFVVGKASGSANIPRSLNGDITDTTSKSSWVKDPGVQKRFKSAIWDPLHEVQSGRPMTNYFIAGMKKFSDPADWPNIVAKLHEFNMAFDQPTITFVSPPKGFVAGGETIAIYGTNFVAAHTTITIGGNPVTNIPASPPALTTVLSGNTPAGSIGKTDVIVTTPVGSVTLPSGYEYVDSSPYAGPTIESISETNGPTKGGQLVTIHGTNFVAANTQITIGGNMLTLVSVAGDSGATVDDTTTLTGTTPAGPAGRPVDVIVATPAGSATLSNGYRYVESP